MEYKQFLEEARRATRSLATLDAARINQLLKDVSAAALEQTDFLLQENQKDLNRMDPQDPRYDRLKLTPERIRDIADDMVNVADLPKPLGRVLSEMSLENGLRVSKVSV